MQTLFSGVHSQAGEMEKWKVKHRSSVVKALECVRLTDQPDDKPLTRLTKAAERKRASESGTEEETLRKLKGL